MFKKKLVKLVIIIHLSTVQFFLNEKNLQFFNSKFNFF